MAQWKNDNEFRQALKHHRLRYGVAGADEEERSRSLVMALLAEWGAPAPVGDDYENEWSRVELLDRFMAAAHAGEPAALETQKELSKIDPQIRRQVWEVLHASEAGSRQSDLFDDGRR